MSASQILARSIRSGSGSPEGAVSGNVGDIYTRTSDGAVWVKTSGAGTNTGWTEKTAGAGSGDVSGPASSTDNAVVRFDGAGGKTLQDSGITIADGATGTLAGSNSGDVTLAGTPDYITISGQVITRAQIDLTADVTGDLPLANVAQASAASKLLGRGDSGAGDFQEITLGSGLAMTGTTLSSSGGASALDDLTDVTITTPGSGQVLTYDGAGWVNDSVAGTGDVVGPASAVDDQIVTFNGTTGKLIQDGGKTIAQLATSTVGIVIDGAGSAISTGVKGFVQVPFAGTITAVRMFADQSGSAVVDVWKDTYANFPPTVADTITASAKPTLSAAQKSEDTTLTGWTTSISAGDVLGFNVDSAATMTRLTLQLVVTR